MDPTDPGFDIPPFMYVFIAIFAIVFLAGVAFSLTTAVRSRKVLRDNGIDPLAAKAQLAVRLTQGPLGAPSKSLEQRLAELDDLYRRGLISDDEHRAARTAALRE